MLLTSYEQAELHQSLRVKIVGLINMCQKVFNCESYIKFQKRTLCICFYQVLIWLANIYMFVPKPRAEVGKCNISYPLSCTHTHDTTYTYTSLGGLWCL